MIHDSTKNLHELYIPYRVIIQLNNYDVTAFQVFKVGAYSSIDLLVLMFHFVF